VIGTKIAADAVTSAKINDGTIQTQDFATDSVDSNAVKDYALLSADYAPQSVNTAALKDNAVTTAKVADDAIDSSKVLNGSLRATDLGVAGTTSVDPAPLANGVCAVTTSPAPGVKTGDRLILNVPAALEDGLVFSGGVLPTSDDTIAVRLCNFTGAPIDGAARTWSYLAVR
jgi:trimeric autotransporter adhesin